MNHVSRLLIASAALVAACSKDVPLPSSPIQISRDIVEKGNKDSDWSSFDDVLEIIGSRVPGFGGLYFDQSGVIVTLTDPASQSKNAEKAIRPILGQSRRYGHFDLARGALANMRFERAEFPFATLMSYKRVFQARMVPAGTVILGVDSRLNKLHIGLVGTIAIDAWTARAREAKIPLDAIFLEDVGVGYPDIAGLRDSVLRPTAGGIQVRSDAGDCTLGATLTISGDSHSYFTTASHCSNEPFKPDTYPSNWYHQLCL